MRPYYNIRWRRRRLRALFLILPLVGFCAWASGLIAFIQAIPRTASASGLETDAVVVLTGGSLRRETGLTLLAAGKTKKLFISGVHKEVTVEEILRIPPGFPQTLACCIVLDYAADNTRENARESAAWMKREKFRSLRLVTANYHMPRSLREFRALMPDAMIVPHPVFPAHVRLGDWWLWPGTAALLAGEYNKLLLAWLRWLVQPVMDAVAPPAQQEAA